jgi:CheY-like chemotaxis protein
MIALMMYTRRILIIEDNEDNLTLMRLLLEREDFEVLSATDGAAGLEIARTERPDLVLLDLAMPDMDGWEVAQHLKADILTQDLPIIAVTAHALPKDRERAFEVGCDRFIVKPYSVAGLLSEIDNLLEY